MYDPRRETDFNVRVREKGRLWQTDKLEIAIYSLRLVCEGHLFVCAGCWSTADATDTCHSQERSWLCC